MLVDSDQVLARLKLRLQEKDSWGRREIQSVLIELEADALVDEGVLENTLRRIASVIPNDLLNAGQVPATVGAAGAGGDGAGIPTTDSQTRAEGEHNGHDPGPGS